MGSETDFDFQDSRRMEQGPSKKKNRSQSPHYSQDMFVECWIGNLTRSAHEPLQSPMNKFLQRKSTESVANPF